MNLLDLAVKIAVDDQASGAVGKIGEKLGNGLKAAAKVGIAAVSAAGAAVVALAKQSIDAYAEYEQLVGGVDTLFKTSSQKVQNYAANAYKTAGMSANEYMSTVTSFSASLLQSLKGDTEAAAEYADMAITDMADNANKMGTSMEMIQNAYQGFAKQNYTMLDNLKLGYGGTKTEMERLIKDANKVKEANGEMANLSIERFGDVVEAIHIIQTEMGITGTTALEASETISGSVASMKAAWKNLKVGIADENADMEVLIGDFTDSAYTAATNILTRATHTVEGIKEIFSDPEQRSKFIQLGKDLLGLISDGMMAIVGVESDEDTSTPRGATVATIKKVVSTIKENMPELISGGKEMLNAIVQGFTDDENAEATFSYLSGWLAGQLKKSIEEARKWFTSGEFDESWSNFKSGFAAANGNNKLSEYKLGRAMTGIDESKATPSADISSPYKSTTHNLWSSSYREYGGGGKKLDVTINYPNPNLSADEIGKAVQEGLEEWEAAND